MKVATRKTIDCNTIPEEIRRRAAMNYTYDPATKCWISNYSTNSNGVTAQIGWQGEDGGVVVTSALRAAILFWRPTLNINDIVVTTTCRNRRCVSPLHLTADA